MISLAEAGAVCAAASATTTGLILALDRGSRIWALWSAATAAAIAAGALLATLAAEIGAALAR
jgi:hypothetical protein